MNKQKDSKEAGIKPELDTLLAPAPLYVNADEKSGNTQKPHNCA